MATKTRNRRAAPETKPSPASPPGPVLELTTLTERRFVKIDGERYDIRNPGELSIIDHYAVAKKSERLQEILDGGRAADELGDDFVAEVSKQLDQVCRLILIAPDEVHKRMTDDHRFLLVTTFTTLLGKADGAEPEGAGAEPQPTGESTSPS